MLATLAAHVPCLNSQHSCRLRLPVFVARILSVVAFCHPSKPTTYNIQFNIAVWRYIVLIVSVPLCLRRSPLLLSSALSLFSLAGPPCCPRAAVVWVAGPFWLVGVVVLSSLSCRSVLLRPLGGSLGAGSRWLPAVGGWFVVLSPCGRCMVKIAVRNLQHLITLSCFW